MLRVHVLPLLLVLAGTGATPSAMLFAEPVDSSANGATGYRRSARETPGPYHFIRHSSRAQRIHFVHRVKNCGERTMEAVRVSVGLPRTDRRQQIHRLKYNVRPTAIVRDDWGQRTATFELKEIPPGSEREFRVTADVTLSSLEWTLADRDIGSVSDIPSRVREKYLRNGNAFQLDNPQIQAAASSLQIADGGFLEQVRRIHDFVADSLEYERDERWDTADVVLERGRGSCSEYAFLMIAMCRLNGIPARYAGGTCLPAAMEPQIYGLDLLRQRSPLQTGDPTTKLPVEQLDRVFHRWVEVYLPRAGWYPIDPTRNDLAAAEGDSYRYFGRLPWFYLVMKQGDGDDMGELGLGNDYRSRTTWNGQQNFPKEAVRVVRFSIWEDPPDRDGPVAYDGTTTSGD
jgi:transglutaminase-like putative cysteine protease